MRRCAACVLRRGLSARGAGVGGQPQPWQIGFQPAATPIMEMIHRFNNGLLIVIVADRRSSSSASSSIVMVRFNARANPVPSKTSTTRWSRSSGRSCRSSSSSASRCRRSRSSSPSTIRPAPSPATIRRRPTLTIKATGNQWYWTYEYPDNGDLSFDFADADRTSERADPADQPRLLAVDNQLVVPVGTVVRMQVIGADVIHAFAVPAFGIKIDAVPGRLNETWFQVDREGVYYGQCSELCGTRPCLHADRGPRGQPGAVRRLGRRPPRPTSTAPTSSSPPATLAAGRRCAVAGAAE